MKGINEDMKEARMKASLEFDMRHQPPEPKHWYSWLFSKEKEGGSVTKLIHHYNLAKKTRRNRRKYGTRKNH